MSSNIVTDLSSIVLLQNLGELLLSNLNSPVYHLTPEQQTVIQFFIQSNPPLFEKLSDDIRDITKDGKIDLYDIPFIFQLLVDIYSLQPLLSEDNLIVFIQYTLNIIIDSKYITLPASEKQVMEAVVNSCIKLLKTNIIPVVKTWRYSFSCF